MPRGREELTNPDALVTRVRDGIAELGDPTKASPMQAYLKSVMPCSGVSAKPLARLCGSVYDESRLSDEEAWREAVLTLWDGAAFREERYAAIALARHRHYREHQQPPALDLYRHLVVTGAWWDLVDDIATHLVRALLERHPDAVRPVLLGWAEEDDLWLRRTAIISQVGRRPPIDRALLVRAVDANLDGSTRTAPALSPYGDQFFVRKAIGWALRDHARHAPEWVRTFVAARGDRLSGLSRREAMRRVPKTPRETG